MFHATSVADGVRAQLDLHLDRIRENLGFDHVFVARVAGGERRIEALSTTGPDPANRFSICAAGMCPVTRAAARSHPVVFAGQVGPQSAMEDCQPAFGVPVMMSGGSLYGVLGGQGAQPSAPPGEIAAKLADFALLITVGLDILHAEEAARQKTRGFVADVIRGHRFHPVFQPVRDVETGEVIYAEGLTRLDESLGVTIPDLLSAAHGIGMGAELELAFARAVFSAPRAPGPIAVNLSEATMRTRAFDEFLSGVAGQPLIVELTEHAPVTDYAALSRAVSRMRSRGVKLAIDDTGAGFTSLRHIIDLKPDILKVDASLSARIDADGDAVALLQFLQNYCDETGTMLVIEGIEREDQVDALRGIGVRYLQGYHVGVPERQTGLANA
ncbi:EAL domain-containing protein [Maritimibacter sp. DP1N21-5]|uniref:EAL domain-containing protein n=1 Tax=Maritimibacter sp. DP1N21-5 TaxID=2836867 RepID=UPI001C474032|nr:EAL domain-containing protein [Maritimibacter sp. DP1N21-5]MBV7410396.1 EAL domain-containing protein [Maritimibacter sp. DP1N21-5]